MNVFLQELRAGRKALLLWSLGVFFLVLAGVTKFSGVEGMSSGELLSLMEKFPKVALAVFGMVGVDIGQLPDYYTVIGYLVMLCAALYGVQLGVGAVSRETMDHTDEFLFTKPRSRNVILAWKLLAAAVLLALLTLVNWGSSLLAVRTLKNAPDISKLIAHYSAAVFLVGLVFLCLAAFFAAPLRRTEKAVQWGNLAFLATFIAAVLYDMLEGAGWLRFLSPLKYFEAPALVKGNFDGGMAALALVLSAALLVFAFHFFRRKDLTGHGG